MFKTCELVRSKYGTVERCSTDPVALAIVIAVALICVTAIVVVLMRRRQP